MGYDDSSFTVVKVDSAGRFTWGQPGIAVPRAHYWPNSLRMAGNDGGIVAVWLEMQPLLSGTGASSRILGQK